ncbi:uncharacterized protein LOC128831368 [Malaclemys terrapin pileata]|uniref:uncharacterized protein LOC128831368 n=1 Tax=Malaclemys terrapin pileata TaxID=2991368 RepID=UPI0023A7DC7C|nr:uncharacterized protein LOC128831368 [Malaclemys terrapin pileata]
MSWARYCSLWRNFWGTTSCLLIPHNSTSPGGAHSRYRNPFSHRNLSLHPLLMVCTTLRSARPLSFRREGSFCNSAWNSAAGEGMGTCSFSSAGSEAPATPSLVLGCSLPTRVGFGASGGTSFPRSGRSAPRRLWLRVTTKAVWGLLGQSSRSPPINTSVGKWWCTPTSLGPSLAPHFRCTLAMGTLNGVPPTPVRVRKVLGTTRSGATTSGRASVTACHLLTFHGNSKRDIPGSRPCAKAGSFPTTQQNSLPGADGRISADPARTRLQQLLKLSNSVQREADPQRGNCSLLWPLEPLSLGVEWSQAGGWPLAQTLLKEPPSSQPTEHLLPRLGPRGAVSALRQRLVLCRTPLWSLSGQVFPPATHARGSLAPSTGLRVPAAASPGPCRGKAPHSWACGTTASPPPPPRPHPGTSQPASAASSLKGKRGRGVQRELGAPDRAGTRTRQQQNPQTPCAQTPH